MIDCMNNVQNNTKGLALFIIMPHGICDRSHKCDKDYLVLKFYLLEGNM